MVNLVSNIGVSKNYKSIEKRQQMPQSAIKQENLTNSNKKTFSNHKTRITKAQQPPKPMAENIEDTEEVDIDL